ncbi:GFA family protein [Neorhizobium lilium]|uniref:GFA family protein n=1 Tax=Neorhizobium lilium TaxID=2503024 RepID=A0A3S3RQM2_9HYPH|nr:GFA family protein [Neorhizobium lilium]RWX75510.1 GFA family protein [Neorhizobium lilium]
MQDTHRGQCLCGAISFETEGPLEGLTACHCSQCRRQTGLHYVATRTSMERLTLHGEDRLQWYRASETANRGFCSICGSALFWQADGSPDISIMAGAFDQPLGLKVAEHIYCADRGDFYDLPDDQAPRYPGDRPSSG